MFLKYIFNSGLKKLLFVTTLLLGGCMDIEQEIWIHADASATIDYRLGLHEHLLSKNRRDEPDSVCDEFFQDKHKLETLDGVENVKQTMRQAGGIIYCSTQVEVRQYRQLQQVHEMIMQAKAGDHRSFAGRFLAEFTLKENKQGEGYFRQHIKNKAGDDENKSRLDIQFMGLTDLFVGQAMAGRYWTITLHVPEIISANIETDSQNQQVIWRVPLYDLMVNQNYAFDMQATFDPELAWYEKLWRWVN